MAICLYTGAFFVGHWLLLVLLLFFEIHPRPRRSGHFFGTHGKRNKKIHFDKKRSMAVSIILAGYARGVPV